MTWIAPSPALWAEIKLDYRARVIRRFVQQGSVCIWNFEIPRQARG